MAIIPAHVLWGVHPVFLRVKSRELSKLALSAGVDAKRIEIKTEPKGIIHFLHIVAPRRKVDGD
jgi:hypothetical protein